MSGGSGDVGPAYLELWGAAELVENNAGYSYFKESAPGLVLIGSDGGGEGFGFDTRAQPAPIVMIPFVSSGWLDALEVASGFGKFLERLAAGYDIFGSPSVPVSRTAKKG